jgi:hypothetical protein
MPSWWRRSWNFSTRSTISSLATAITKLSSVSSSAMVETEDGKNCGVSTATTKPWSAARMIGLAGAVGQADDGQPCSRAIDASTTSVR